jgi:hypothetical protein
MAQREDGAEMRGAPLAGGGEGHRIALLAHQGEEFRHGVGAEAAVADQAHRHVGEEADGLEAGERVKAGVLEQRWRRGDADVVRQQRVAVGRGAGDGLGADVAAAAADVLDGHGLVQLAPQGVGEDPRDDVAAAARGVGRDQRDGAVGVALLRPGRGQ